MSLFFCKDCQKWHEESISNCLVIDGALICSTCKENYRQCKDCEEWHHIDETYNVDGAIICENCMDNGNYFYCEHCEEWHNEDVTSIYIVNEYTRDSMYICENCIDSYYRCDDCGRYYSYGFINRDDCHTQICNDCFENYTRCEDCGCIIHIDDSYYNEDTRHSYCYECYDNNKNTFIYDYGDHPSLQFNKLEDEENNTLFFGFELEIAIDTDYAEKFLSFFKDGEIYLSYDSSVDGFEIVSHPMSWNYLNGDFKKRLESALNFAKSVDAKGHNAGGMHIHISRNGINDTQLKRLHNFLYAKNNHKKYEILKTISQRRDENLHWCSFDENSIKKLYYKRNLKTLKKDTYQSNKYTSINLNHTYTIEFRMFNSNLRIERVLKNLEFIKALLDYTNLHNCKSLYKHFFKWLADIENRNKYNNLFSFLCEKNLIKPLKHNLILLGDNLWELHQVA